jgi:deoxyribodipyrimidine photo-lyase
MQKTKKYKKAVVWFWNNLRVHDNQALYHALKESEEVIGLYVFHPKDWQEDRWGFPKTGRFRAHFLKESLMDLKQRLMEALRVPLYFYEGSADKAFRHIQAQYPFEAVFFQNEWTQEEEDIVKAARTACPQARWQGFYDQLLYMPAQINPLFSAIPDVFTRFRKTVEQKAQVMPPLPLPRPQATVPALSLSRELPHWLNACHVKIHPQAAFSLPGGETHALKRMQNYLWEQHGIARYKQTRNGLIGLNYSSKLSPFLANSSLSVRLLYAEIKRYEAEVQANDSTYWLFFELLWREYFKYMAMKYRHLLFHRKGFKQRNYTWAQDMERFERWRQGKTGHPFIDANMRELLHTGWMSNRGRQNVASFLAKHRHIDLRMGAAWFESQHIDNDVHSNYGNWQYVAGVGNDPRDRLFNPDTQAQRYDPQGDFQRLWLQGGLFYA